MADYFRPGAVAHTYLGSYSDFIDHLSMWAGGSALAASQQMVRRAIETAYRGLVLAREWKYFATDGRISTNAPYNTGTITYTHSTLTVTLSGGTWPTWAANGRLVIANNIHEVVSRTDGTTLILSPNMNPGANVASGTSYTLYQNVYDLPADFRSLRQVINANNLDLIYLPQQDGIWRERFLRNSGYPQFFSIWPNPNAYGVHSLALYPYPSTSLLCDVPYQRFPRPLRYSGFAANDCVGTITNSGTAVTGTSTAFTAGMVGSLLRIGTTADLPTSTAGTAPYQEQHIITAVTDATHLTLDSAPGATYTGAKYRVTDPVDLPEFMYMAFLRRCELEAAMNLRMDKSVPGANAAYYQALTQACEGDNQSLGTREAASGLPFAWWNQPLQPGQG